MKSITVTTQRSINYGAVLQAYALQKAQIKLGIENLLLDTPCIKKLYTKIDWKLSRKTLIDCVSNAAYLFHKKEMDRLLSKFDDFVQNNIKLTRVYNNYADLIKEHPKADFYINGSDQVFGLRGPYDKIRLLCFLDNNIVKCSYAASLGEYDWDEEEKVLFRNIIRDYLFVSVREKYAKEYIESFSDVKCEVHVDPVFLLEKYEWKKIISDNIIGEPYILCYPLIGNVKMQDVINKLKAKTGLKTVSVSPLPIKRIKADKYIFDAGPAEFLSLLYYADYVITTSFHGTAFSLLFEKDFYTLIKDYKYQRITNLLELVGLSSRVVSERDTNFVLNNKPIDFTYCKTILQKERDRGYLYLKKIINSIQNSIDTEE